MTGANRGIGRALVEEALRRGAKRVYAGTPQPLAHPDGRVTTPSPDVTDGARIRVAAESVEAPDVLVSKAAAFSLTQAPRENTALLAVPRGPRRHTELET